MTIIRKSDVPVIDMFDASEEVAAIRKGSTAAQHGRNATNMNNYVIGVAVDRRIQAGDKQADLLAPYGLSQASVSKAQTIATLARFTEDTPEDLQPELSDLATYWGHAAVDVETNHGTVGDCLKHLAGDDGDDRALALIDMLKVFGAPSSAYSVAKGKKVHPSDPRANTPEPEQDDQGDDDQGDQDDQGESTSWEDRLTALIAQAKLEGASTSDILHVVNVALKG